MTYTLFMPADQGIQIADDGVAEVSMTAARANLTRLIRHVREGGGEAAFTERGERRAYVVTPDAHEQARLDRLVVTACLRVLGNLPDEERTEVVRKIESCLQIPG